MQLIDPFPGCYDASDPFGNTHPPRTYPHTGSDWIVGRGRAIPAIGAGVVAAKGWHDGNGNYLSVKLDGSSLYYAYLHMDEPAHVNVGDHVEVGQVVGVVGDTGTNARGYHLHVTVSDLATAYVGLGKRQDPWALIQSHLTTTPAGVGSTPITEETDDMARAFFRMEDKQQPLGNIKPGTILSQEEPAAPLLFLSAEQWAGYQATGGKYVNLSTDAMRNLVKRVGTFILDGSGHRRAAKAGEASYGGYAISYN